MKTKRAKPFFVAVVATSAGVALGCGSSPGGSSDECPQPTLAQCQDADWLETNRCGMRARDAMRADPHATCNELLAEYAKSVTEGIPDEEVAVPSELGGGVGIAKVVPNPGEGLSDIVMPATQEGYSQRNAMGATEAGLSPAEQALRDAWDANGNRVASCREYVYEKYWDYTQFEDRVAARYAAYPYITATAFAAAGQPGALATRGAEGRSMKMKDGTDMTVQAPEWGFIVPVGPDNDCYLAWGEIRLGDSVFVGMPKELVTQGEDEKYHLRDRRCYHQPIDDPRGYDLPAAERWRWHGELRSGGQTLGYSPVALDAEHANVREFQQTLYAWAKLQQNGVPSCCGSAPASDCCTEYQAAETSLGARLRELFDVAADAGCLADTGVTVCDWSPNLFVESLRRSFGAAMEQDYQRCLELTGDDLTGLTAFRFHLPDGSVWPAAASCDYRAWPTCPVGDYTVTASAIDVFFTRFAEFEAAVGEYWEQRRAAMPKELFDAAGRLKLPGGRWGDHHEAGNAGFGVYYDYLLEWGIPHVVPSAHPTTAELCVLGPQATASFSAGAWAFGSARIPAIDARFGANFDDVFEGHLEVLGDRIWSQGPVGDWLVNSSVALSRNVVPPCGRNATSCPPYKMRFSVAGIPMSVSGAVAGALSLGATFDGDPPTTYRAGEPCWTFRMGFKPGLDLKGVAALAVDIGAASAGISCDLTLIGLSLPVTFEVAAAGVLPVGPGGRELLKITVSSGADLVVRLLDGKIAVFIKINLGIFSASYSFKLFGWAGIRRSWNLFTEPYQVPFDDLLELIRQESR